MKKINIIIAAAITLVISMPVAQSQTFLNGDFEKNHETTGVDQINLSNADFNTRMPNTFGFGTYGDVDIINTATYSGLAQKGDWFIGLTGGGTDAISMELSTPLVTGKTYTITFWDRGSSGFVPQPVQIGVSNAKDAFGTIVYTALSLPVIGVWTKRIVKFVSPSNGKYITVQLSGANNIGDWAQVDNFSFDKPENTIITGIITGGPFCAGMSIGVPFTSNGIFATDNIYTAQLSDANGDFTNAVKIGTLKSNLNTGTIICTLPQASISGSSYRVRVIGSKPDINGSDNGTDLTINSTTSPLVTIDVNPGTTVNVGTSVTFTANAINGGTNPKYQWKVNGINAGTNSAAFTSSTLKTGDVVSLTLISNAPCATVNTAFSNLITMTVKQMVAPSVTIVVSPSNTIREGSTVTFRAAEKNGGTMPAYQWKVNGNYAGNNSPVFTTSNLKDGDVVTVELTSNSAQVFPANATSNAISMVVTIPAQVTKTSNTTAVGTGSSHHAKSKLHIKAFRFNKRFMKLKDAIHKNCFGKKTKHSKRMIKHCFTF